MLVNAMKNSHSKYYEKAPCAMKRNDSGLPQYIQHDCAFRKSRYICDNNAFGHSNDDPTIKTYYGPSKVVG